MKFQTTDWIFFIIYLVAIIGFALYISFKKRGKSETTESYFLAGKSLPWWIIGGSLIASNISAEQFIGMSGDAFRFGLGIATYEFMAALTLIFVAWFMLPVYLQKGIYTMPQFVEQRYNGSVRTGLAIFWLLLFVFVNITSVLYLGALTMENTLGINLIWGVIGLAIYSATFSIFGGLRTVVWTDLIQVVFLIGGGLFTTYFALEAYSGGSGFFEGLSKLFTDVNDRFNMVLNKGEIMYTNDDGGISDAWDKLPGLSVLIGGMWIANFYYWGTNQYIIQRALAAKNIGEARKGIAFAAFMKLFLPLIVVIPGIAAYAMKADLEKGDQVYSWVLNEFIGTGFKGLCFAAVVAAVGSSISSIVNSVSTIFTMDIYRHLSPAHKEKSEAHLVKVGKITAGIALLIGVLIAPQFITLGSAFSFIQKYTGFFSPGILVIFMFGMFWKRASSKAAMLVVLLSLPLSIIMDLTLPQIPFMNQMGISFILLSLLLIVVSMIQNKGDDENAIQLEKGIFKTATSFKVSALIISGILAAIYALMY